MLSIHCVKMGKRLVNMTPKSPRATTDYDLQLKRFNCMNLFFTASTLKRTQPLFITTQEKLHKDRSDR